MRACGDTPTWRYRFANGQTFTSSLRREYAEAQANAVGVPIVLVEKYVSGEWRPLKRVEDQDNG